MNEKKIKHLEMIQNIIDRIARNSFLLKGWSVTLISAIFVLANKNTNKNIVVLAYFPTIMFAILDIYYLRLERLFRKLYNHVATLNEKQVDFLMDFSKYKKDVSIISVLFSPSIFIFYFVLLASIYLIRFI